MDAKPRRGDAGPAIPLHWNRRLLGRLRREYFASRGFRFRLRLRGLLRFFSAFIFASHAASMTQTPAPEKPIKRIQPSTNVGAPGPSHLGTGESTNPILPLSTHHEKWDPRNRNPNPRSSASSPQPQTPPANSSITLPGRRYTLSPPTALSRPPAPAVHPHFSGCPPRRPRHR